MEIIFVLTGLIFLIISAFVTEDEPATKCISFFLGVVIIGFSLFYLAYRKGEERGAYNQLRGKYDVTYVIDKDSCVVDTIINFN